MLLGEHLENPVLYIDVYFDQFHALGERAQQGRDRFDNFNAIIFTELGDECPDEGGRYAFQVSPVIR